MRYLMTKKKIIKAETGLKKMQPLQLGICELSIARALFENSEKYVHT